MKRHIESKPTKLTRNEEKILSEFESDKRRAKDNWEDEKKEMAFAARINVGTVIIATLALISLLIYLTC